MSYPRVLPRDLFNEASLLKCLGQLSIHAERIADPAIFRVTHRTGGFGGFDIRQNPDDGSIHCANVQIVIRERLWNHHRPLNSRAPWPLWVVPAFGHPDDAEGWNEETEAFDGHGNLGDDLARLIERPLT